MIKKIEIDKEYVDEVSDLVLSGEFPWFYRKRTTRYTDTSCVNDSKTKDNPQLVHVIYFNGKPMSSDYHFFTGMLNCIERGITSGEKEVPVAEPEVQEQDAPVTEPETDDTEGAEKDAWDTIEAGKLGYCTFLKFKCAGSRTCNSWVVGGPIKDK